MKRRQTLFAGAVLALAATTAKPIVYADDRRGDESLEAPLATGEIERIGIDDLISVAVRVAPKLVRAKADIRVARGQRQAASGIDDWQLSVAASASRRTSNPVPGQPVQVTASESYEGRLGLARNLPTGGRLSLGVESTRTKEDHQVQPAAAGADPSTSNSSATAAAARIELTHPLLRGLGRGVARVDLEKAELAATAGELRARVEAGEMIREAINGYWELAYAAIGLEVRRASLAAAKEVLKEAKLAVRKGDRAKTELQSAEYGVAVREEGVLQAEIAVEEASLALRRLAGLEIGPDRIALWPSELPDVIRDQTLTVSSAVKRGLRRNPALRAAVLDGKGAQIDVRVAKNGKRPRLDLSLNAGAVGTGRNVDEAIRFLGEKTEYQVSAGLSFSLDIGNNAGKGAYAAARGRDRIARIGVRELRRDVSSAIVLAIHRVRAARKRAKVAAKATTLAKANFKAERARFQAGLSSSRELYERQGEIDDAKLSRARALADFHQAVAQMQTLTGEILEEYGLEVEAGE